MKPLRILLLLGAPLGLFATSLSGAAACCAPAAETTQACCAQGDASCCAAKDGQTTAAGTEAQAANPVLETYTRLSDALVVDDLAAAKAEAAALAEAARSNDDTEIAELAEGVANSESLAQARERLVGLSQRIIALAGDEQGYYVMNCPMVRNGQWLQSDREIRNPYMGQRMVRCGVVQRATGS